MMKYDGNGAAVPAPEGRIDSSNAREFEKEVLEALEQRPEGPLLLDFDRLEYISSAGLRVLLTAAKRSGKPPSVRNVSPEVYEILDVTGFTSLMKVERKLRRIDVTGCEVIARGGTSTVYRLDPDTIVKVYEIPDALEMIRNEQRCAKKAFLKGIPTAISYDAVRVGEHYGSVFELVNARTFAELLAAEPERADELIRKHVEIIRRLHSIEAEPDELPDCREIYLRYLEKLKSVLPPELHARLEGRFRAMPPDLHMIHGDIHMKNVMLCGDEPMLIDMETLSTGNPVFDLGDLFIAYQAFNADDPGNSLKVLGLPKAMCDRIWEKTTAQYLGTSSPESLRRIMTVGYVRFLYLVAVLRLGGGELAGVRIRNAVRRLSELTEGTDGAGIAIPPD